jgi:uncharacterized damage-inducible protein DinB
MEYRSRAVRALVRLQISEMRRLLDVWADAKKRNLRLPSVDDPAYTNLDALFLHPLKSSRGYLHWISDFSGCPRPEIDIPGPEGLLDEAQAVVDRLSHAWEESLSSLSDEDLDSGETKPRWNVPLTIEGMMEHAVVHPMRHRLQLEDLMRQLTA